MIAHVASLDLSGIRPANMVEYCTKRIVALANLNAKCEIASNFENEPSDGLAVAQGTVF